MLGSIRRLALAGVAAALIGGLAPGIVAAAGSPVVGHVYVNNNSAGHNSIAAFDRHADGSLSPVSRSPPTHVRRVGFRTPSQHHRWVIRSPASR
jgi:hypothetical protein